MNWTALLALLPMCLAACAAPKRSDEPLKADVEWVEQGCRFSELPALSEDATPEWKRLVSSQSAPFVVDLEAAEEWYSALLQEAQSLFRTSEPSSVDWLEQNTQNRRAFIELWMSRERPVVVISYGGFALSGDIGETLAAAAYASGDSELARTWIGRSASMNPLCR